MLENRSCHVLERICDEAGGRIMGSPANIKAIGIVREELHKLGIETKEEYFDALLWERGDDVVTVTYPFTRILKAVALGYVDSVPQFSSKIVYA